MNRLDEFYELMTTLREQIDIVTEIFTQSQKSKLNSSRLCQLVNFKQLTDDNEEEDQMEVEEAEEPQNIGIFPDYLPILDEFDNNFVWKYVGNKRVPEPRKGIDEELDQVNVRIEQVRQQLDDYIEDVKKTTGCPDVKLFSSTGIFRFQIEVPQKVKLDPDEYIETSNAKGKQRYMTDTLEQLTE